MDLAGTGYLGTIADDGVVKDMCVVADVYTLHNEVTVADNRLSTGMGGTIDDYVFANDVPVADDELGLFARKLKVLWEGGEYGALMYDYIIAHTRAVHHAYERINLTVVADDDIAFYVGKRHHGDIVAQLGLRVYVGLGTYIACHRIAYLII